MAKLTSEFQSALEDYIAGCNHVFNVYWKANEFSHEKDEISYKVGRRYVKVVQGNRVHSFVDLKEGFEGNVYKPASWNAPAKHARGNIFDKNNGLKDMGPHGPAYLR